MTSEATVMSKPSSRGTPLFFPPSPTMVLRKARSFMSRARRKVMRRGSMLRLLPCCRWLSIIAASILCAVVTACRSPVKCRLISSMGTTWEYPPPAAPPFTPMLGPNDGSRSAMAVFLPSFARAWPKPTVVVVFPSPAAVGLMAVIKMRWPSGLSAKRLATAGDTLALYLPYSSRSSSVRPILSAILTMGSICALCAISMSDFNSHSPLFLCYTGSSPRCCGPRCCASPVLRSSFSREEMRWHCSSMVTVQAG